MINDLFIAIAQLWFFIFMLFVFVDVILSLWFECCENYENNLAFNEWLNEPQPTLGCPDPELHDRHNEARHGDVIAAAINFNQPIQG